MSFIPLPSLCGVTCLIMSMTCRSFSNFYTDLALWRIFEMAQIEAGKCNDIGEKKHIPVVESCPAFLSLQNLKVSGMPASSLTHSSP